MCENFPVQDGWGRQLNQFSGRTIRDGGRSAGLIALLLLCLGCGLFLPMAKGSPGTPSTDYPRFNAYPANQGPNRVVYSFEVSQDFASSRWPRPRAVVLQLKAASRWKSVRVKKFRLKGGYSGTMRIGAALSRSHPRIQARLLLRGGKRVLLGSEPVLVKVSSPKLSARSVSIGSGHACAILPSRMAACWGDNFYGQLGTGDTRDRLAPVRVKGLGRVRAIEPSEGFTCAIRITARVMCWGDNIDGALGTSRKEGSLRPLRVAGLTGVRQLSSSWINICALKFNGRVFCWGDRAGFGSKGGIRFHPTRVPRIRNAVSIAVGTYSSCAVKRSHRVVCWSNPEFRIRPKRNLGKVLSLQVDLENGCAIRVTHRVVCWGTNFEGQLGVGRRPGASSKPLLVRGLGRVKALSTDTSTACAIRLSGKVLCWGANDGAVGDGTYRTRFHPVSVPGVTAARTISVNGAGACAASSYLQTWCWGVNSVGEMGTGTLVDQLLPARILGVR